MNLLLAVLLPLAASATAATPRAEFASVLELVKKDPADAVLRKKAISMARGLKPAPAIPLEAKRAFVMGGTYQKEAKSPAAFNMAVDAFRDASKLAPWWGDAYYNLSVSLESAGRLDEAKDALNLYLLTKPKDAEAAQNRLFALEAKANLAGAEAASARAAVVAQTRSEDSIEGNWWTVYQRGNADFQNLTVTRNGGSFGLTIAYGDMPTLKDFTATETTLRFTVINGMSVDTYNMRREGAEMVGTATSVISGADDRTIPVRMIRK